VDKFIGKDYRNIDDQLAASDRGRDGGEPISLVNVELNDTGTITQAGFGRGEWAAIDAVGMRAGAGSLRKQGAGISSLPGRAEM